MYICRKNEKLFSFDHQLSANLLQQADDVLEFISLYEKISEFCNNFEAKGKILQTFIYSVEEELMVNDNTRQYL